MNNNISKTNNSNSTKSTAALLKRVVSILTETHAIDVPKADRVVEFKHPKELQHLLNLSLDQDEQLSDPQIDDLFRQVVKHCVRTSHSYFHNQLYAGVDRYSLAGAWITESLNTSQYTYEVAPVFTLVELTVIRTVLNLVGFQNGDGIFAPGGSISNMYGMTLARFKSLPDVKKTGNNGVKLTVFTSTDSHYSTEKGVHWLGIGTNNLVKVQTNERGQMIPSELEKSIQTCIQNGGKPFFVNATAGTTVLGAFDPLVEINAICKKYNIWLHVDACWGGSLLLSSKYRDRLKGLQSVDSISWNPHKMMGVPLQCSLFLVNDDQILKQSNSVGASYLFPEDKFYDISYDTGDKSIQCGRKVDAFKFWCMWKAYGNKQLQLFVDNAMESAHYFKKLISQRDGFRLVIPDGEFECTNICFWYIPKYLRNKTEDAQFWEKMHKVAPAIKEKLTLSGSIMVGYTPLKQKNLKNFFRMIVTCHPLPTHQDMEYIVKEIATAGERLSEC